MARAARQGTSCTDDLHPSYRQTPRQSNGHAFETAMAPRQRTPTGACARSKGTESRLWPGAEPLRSPGSLAPSSTRMSRGSAHQPKERHDEDHEAVAVSRLYG